jgi:alpha-beta hydrolase superfamily lysophospholipase
MLELKEGADLIPVEVAEVVESHYATTRVVLPHGSRFIRMWAPGQDARGKVLLCHGYGEHSGRYEHVGHGLADAGFKVYALDLFGHGEDIEFNGPTLQPPPGVKTVFDTFVDDVEALLQQLGQEDGLPLFLFGHSMGGLIAVMTALRMLEKGGWKCKGLLLSAPAIRLAPNKLVPAPYCCLFRCLANCAACCVPTALGPGVSANQLTSDEEVLEQVRRDEKNFGGQISMEFANEFCKTTIQVQAQLRSLTCPWICQMSDSDAVCDPRGAKQLELDSISKDKTLILHVGLRHEILNEAPAVRAPILAKYIEWLVYHLA